MNHNKIILYTSVCLVVAMTSALALLVRYNELKPKYTSQDTPIVTFNDEPNNSSRPSLTDTDKKEADTPSKKQPSVELSQPVTLTQAPIRTDNAPKQSAIRQTVAEEYTYYPLLTPNDPGFSSSWALQRVNATPAWDVTVGNSQTIVAVIDTGFALNHEDLTSSWAINAAETGMTKSGDRCWTGTSQDKKINDCDNDGDGYKNNWRGWNFYLGDNNPMAGRTNPAGEAVAHGTETSGLVGAAGNNGLGIATINLNTKILPLQVLGDDGPGYTSDVIAAIYYAVDHGASVINMSLGGASYDPAMKTATDYAYNNNVVVIAAAGNCGTGTEQGCQGAPAGSMGYPALNDHVVSVGASDINNQRASFSSYGPGLSLLAPGSGSIVSPTWTSTNDVSLYSGALYGTSFASPQVASLASLIKSIRPASSVDDISALLMATASKLPSMAGANFTNKYGHGIINAGVSLSVTASLNTTSSAPKLLQAGGVRSEHSFSATDTLGSGCIATTNTYCSVWLRDSQTGFERYLPYKQVSTSSVGWSWSGAMLKNGNWDIRAVQGDSRSASYGIFNK